MTTYGLLQALVIALAILLSAWTVLGSLAPQWRQRLLQRLGRRPRAQTLSKPACDTGCSHCDGCASPRPPAREQPIRFQPPR